MIDGAAFSPKYWVGHDNEKFDVFLSTARKSRDEVDSAMQLLFGEEWFLNECLEIILIEVKKVTE